MKLQITIPSDNPKRTMNIKRSVYQNADHYMDILLVSSTKTYDTDSKEVTLTYNIPKNIDENELEYFIEALQIDNSTAKITLQD